MPIARQSMTIASTTVIRPTIMIILNFKVAYKTKTFDYRNRDTPGE